MKVLIVDDEPVNRKLLRTILAIGDHTVFEAEDGLTALETLEREKIDAVISDILMPRMDGYRLCYEIRKNEKLREIPFIAHTATYMSPADEQVALDFGADKFIRKPASAEVILNTLREVMTDTNSPRGKELEAPHELIAMREYSEALVRKLEKNNRDLVEANKAIEERAVLAEFSANVANALTHKGTLSEILHKCAEIVVRHLDIAFARVWTLNSRDNVLELQASAGMYTHVDGRDLRIPVGKNEVGIIASERKPYLTNSVIEDARMGDQEWAQRHGLIAFAGYPLLVEERLVGVMAIFARKPITENVRHAISSAADGIALGIERKKTEDELQARYREMETLHEIGRYVLNSSDLEELMDGILERAMKIGAFDLGVIRLLDGSTNSLKSMAIKGYSDPENTPRLRNPASESMSAHPTLAAFIQDKLHIEENVPAARGLRGLKKEAAQSMIAVPVRAGKKGLGILQLASRTPRRFEPGEVTLLEAIGNHVGIAVQKAILHEETSQNLYRIRALHEIHVAVSAVTDLKSLLQVLLEKIALFLPFPVTITVRLFNRLTGKFENTAGRRIEEREWKAGSERGTRDFIEILKTKSLVIIPDIQNDSQQTVSEFFRKEGFVSYLGLPLMTKDRIVGILSFYTKESHEFSQEEIDFLCTLAGQAAIAIHNSQLLEETERRRREGEELARVAQSLTDTLDMTAVAERITESVRELLSVKGAALTVVERDGSSRRLTSTGQISSETVSENTAASAAGITKLAIAERRPIWSADILNEPETRQNHQLRDSQIRWRNRSMMVAPLHAHDRFVGTLELRDETGRLYSESEVALLQTFADQAAVALQNARLYEQTERHAKRIETLRDIHKAITSTLSLTKALEIFLEKVEGSCPFAAATGVTLLDNENQRLVPVAARNIPLDQWKTVMAESTRNLTDTLKATKSPVAISNLEREARTGGQILSRQYGLVSYLGIPLVIKDEFIGAFLIYTREVHEFTPEEIEFCASLGSQAAIAIYNAKLYLQTEQHLKRIQALREIDKAINSTLDLRAMLDILLQKIEIFIPFPAATTIRLLNPSTGRFEDTAGRGINEAEWKADQENQAGQFLEEVFDRPLIINDIQGATGAKVPEFFRKHGFASYLGLPLAAKNDVVGILDFYTRRAHEFTQQEMDFLLMLSGQASMAIHNARLYQEAERRRRAAEELARVAQSLTETLEISAVGERIVSSVRDFFGVKGATLRLLQPDGSMHAVVSSGEVFSRTIGGDILPPSTGITSRAVAERTPIWSADVLNDREVHLTDEMRDYQSRTGNHSMIAAPLYAHGKLIGTLTLSDQTGRTYSESDVALLRTFGDQAALALENSQLYEETNRANKELETTNRFLGRSLKQLGSLYSDEISAQRIIGGIIDPAATTLNSGEAQVPQGLAEQIAITVENSDLSETSPKAPKQDR